MYINCLDHKNISKRHNYYCHFIISVYSVDAFKNDIEKQKELLIAT